MNLIDSLDFYAMEHNSDDLFLMLTDYPLDSRLDRDTMNKAIIKKLGAARPITTETTVFKFMLDEFFTRYSDNIKRLVDTMYYEYNPLDNKKIIEKSNSTNTVNQNVEATETEHRESTADIDNTDNYTTTNNDTTINDGTNETQVSAYDSNTYQPKEKVDIDNTTTLDATAVHNGTTTSDITSDVDTSKDNSTTTNKTDQLYANKEIVGKDNDTSYQELINQERELAEFNIYNWIIGTMRKELFLLIY